MKSMVHVYLGLATCFQYLVLWRHENVLKTLATVVEVKLPQKNLVQMSGERSEQNGEGHDQAADDRREPGRLPAAERDQQRRHQVRQTEVRRADPDWKKVFTNQFMAKNTERTLFISEQ